MTKLLELMDESSLCLPEESIIRRIPLEQSFTNFSVGSTFYSGGRELCLKIVMLNREDRGPTLVCTYSLFGNIIQ